MVGDRYWTLVKRLPLKSLENESEYELAQEISEELHSKEDAWTEDEIAYFSVLAKVMREYEFSYLTAESCKPADMLFGLLEDHGLVQADLIELLGVSQGRMSELVRGKRPLTTRHAMLLALRFNVSPSLFLPSMHERRVPVDGDESNIRQKQLDNCIEEFYRESHETKNVYLARDNRTGILIEAEANLEELLARARGVFSALLHDRKRGPHSYLTITWYE